MKLKFGMVITDGANKLGGNVISKNHYGRFARRLVIPTNTRTIYTAAARGNFGFLASNYQALSSAQKTAWAAQCINYPRLDNVGNTYYPTAQTLYIMLNRNIFTAGQALITNPPVKSIPAGLGAFTFNGSTPHFFIEPTSGNFPNAANLWALIYATTYMSPAVQYVKSQYRLITVVACTGQVHSDVYTPYLTKFALDPSAGNIWFKVIIVDSISGSASIPNSEQALL